MPSIKKRINLTVPDHIYEKLQDFKEQNGISNDASACLQLVTMQLKAQETSRAFYKVMQESSIESLMEISRLGLEVIKDEGMSNKILAVKPADIGE